MRVLAWKGVGLVYVCVCGRCSSVLCRSRKLDGSIVPLKVRLADRVLTAKRRLERVTSYPALDQTFIFQGAPFSLSRG